MIVREEDLPADVRKAVAQASALEERRLAEQELHRRAVVTWGAVLCTCRPWHVWLAPEPPQAHCVVHGALMITASGNEVL